MAVNFTEHAFHFACAGETLLGIIAAPAEPKPYGLLIVVGGPQYRVVSHRQFLLLARTLAKVGYPVMRFDNRGMGDSTGDLQAFEMTNDDIAGAISAFYEQCPTIKKVVIWGLCDAASASLLYYDAKQDPRLGGLVLLNPWVRSEATMARVRIKHYYGQRLLEAEFWRKLLTGQVGVGQALGGFIKSSFRARQNLARVNTEAKLSFIQKMARGLAAFNQPVLLILSGDDYTAKEFLESVKADPAWSDVIGHSKMTQTTLDGADHTFSSVKFRQKVENITQYWLDTEVARSDEF